MASCKSSSASCCVCRNAEQPGRSVATATNPLSESFQNTCAGYRFVSVMRGLRICRSSSAHDLILLVISLRKMQIDLFLFCSYSLIALCKSILTGQAPDSACVLSKEKLLLMRRMRAVLSSLGVRGRGGIRLVMGSGPPALPVTETRWRTEGLAPFLFPCRPPHQLLWMLCRRAIATLRKRHASRPCART
jgi:hypothetical protein